jgi:uncharacterized repeat protein (TIGR02543 family)
MRTILSVRRHHYLKRVGIFLILVALIAGIVSCGGDEVGPYDLTMAADPAGGGTATDETNESPYEEGAAVSIKAVAAAGYEFAGWTATAGEFDDANAEETTFTMPAQDVTVTANFEPTPLDHFKAYGIPINPGAGPAGLPYVGEVVDLEDQFGSFTATVGWGMTLCNPVEKTHDGVTTPVSDPDHHLMAFALEYEDEPQWWRVTVSNQFGTQELTVAGPISLTIPTQKVEPGGHEPPEGLDCFLGYEVIDPQSVEVVVDLSDQFGDEQNVLVTQAKSFANPVKITHDGEVTEIVNPDAHLVSYWTLAEGVSMEQREVVVSNRFGEYTLNATKREESVLVVPSQKISWEPMEPPLDHFRCYNWHGEMPNPGEVVELTDEFGTFNATVGLGTTLCSPVEKAVNEIAAWEWVPISHPDYHLMLYMLEDIEPQEWVVTVNNQFGEQELTVSGPGGLAVPTRKDPHGEPVGLDYFLVYEVTESPSMDVIVDLTDEFGGGDNNFEMVEPFAFIFGSPVRITHDGEVTNIVNPDDHLVFYWMRDEDAISEVHTVDVSNPFGQWQLDLFQGDEALLAVPSEKITWEPL